MEVWKDCVGYEGLYQVSNLGRVWSCRNKIVMKQFLNHRGYLYVNLTSEDGKQKNVRVHRLVAIAFIPNAENKPQVNHKDENKQNNCVENLEWMTNEENTNYGTGVERAKKILKKPIYCIELDRTFGGAIDVERELNISRSSICAVCKGRVKTAGGYHWKYI